MLQNVGRDTIAARVEIDLGFVITIRIFDGWLG
jgi:hypothetical protein